MSAAPNPSPFLRLPTEIRLMIYELLLLPASAEVPLPREKNTTTAQDSQDNADDPNPLVPPRTLQIRTIDPQHVHKHLSSSSSRSTRPTYHARSTAIGAPRFSTSGTQPTTYTLRTNPGLQGATGLLGTCRLVHSEAAAVLYSSYMFDFDTHIEAVEPFLSALTTLARRSVTRLRLVKGALPGEKEWDRAEWKSACEYMARELRREELVLELGVVAGKPGSRGSRGSNPDAGEEGNGAGDGDGDGDVEFDGWDGVPELSVDHFRLVQPRRALAGIDFEWVEQLVVALRGCRDVRVRAVVERCAPPGANEMVAFWVSFSKSVERAFRVWLRSMMVA
ncbi:uncharacterized protein IWZ02DRAFT_380151 [Phyllosticta citriasiana]|uniref:Uncharacterized protein n=1 Tax=Phyllosticta citriasiana TaxID=595635 RepID=A0ABR1KKI1_9PEZI